MTTYTPEQIAKIILRTPDRVTAGTRVPKFGMGKLVSLTPSFFNSAGRAYRDATAPEELATLGFSSKQMLAFERAVELTQLSTELGAMANLAWHSGRMASTEDASTQAFTNAYADATGMDTFIDFLKALATQEPAAFITIGPDLPPGPVPQTA